MHRYEALLSDDFIMRLLASLFLLRLIYDADFLLQPHNLVDEGVDVASLFIELLIKVFLSVLSDHSYPSFDLVF